MTDLACACRTDHEAPPISESRARPTRQEAPFRPRQNDRTRNPHLDLEVDLIVLRHNVEGIAIATGVEVMPVVKADAYGLGADVISDAIADLASGFCVFQAREAIAADLAHRTGKRVLALGPPESLDPSDYIANGITPAVCNTAQARELRKARPALCIDTGMQRFACRPEECREALVAGDCQEAFTHATQRSHVEKFRDLTSGHDLMRHAAASSLLHDELAVLDAVRPGLAMYRNAIRVSSRIAELHSTKGSAGYSGFTTARHGIILAGYAHGLRKGPCLINGRRSRLLEVGMQTSFVEADADDRVGDSVVLLGENLTEHELSQHWSCGPHEVLTSLSFASTRRYFC